MLEKLERHEEANAHLSAALKLALAELERGPPTSASTSGSGQ
jgi:hypothetical protein